MSIHDWQIAGAPLAVIDVETTGLVPGRDKIIEVAVVHVDPGRSSTTALDTLVNPLRPVPERVHGLSTGDLASAPTFAEIAGDLLRAISSRVLVAHHAYFDVRRLTEVLALCGFHQARLPFLCTMHLRPALRLGPKQRLSELCAASASPTRAIPHMRMHWPSRLPRPFASPTRIRGSLSSLGWAPGDTVEEQDDA